MGGLDPREIDNAVQKLLHLKSSSVNSQATHVININ